MDTATHVITGIGLAGLAHVDPTIANNPELLLPIICCTILGSNAPDADVVCKMKGNETYVKNHRGISHSIPALFFWSGAIAGLASSMYGGSFFFTFFFWTLVAVILHVSFDMLNIYGTQALRPVSQKWIAFYLLPIFDPFIFVLHIIGISWWIYQGDPRYVFVGCYGLIALYILVRILVHRSIGSSIRHLTNSHTLLPTMNLGTWRIIDVDHECFRLGKYENGVVSWTKEIPKTTTHNEIVRASKENTFIRYILQHSKYVHAKIIEKYDGYEVHWFDLRYQSKIDEPFIAIIELDKKLKMKDCTVKRGLIAAPLRT
ncbi:metal-dependent hydrolase [Bacillus alkalicellulosilyticus]|uniref:metal-dependent hydrolase n=1 Tax=Alkalihalobacterium alkalicellulosilyticum TaxID=1912214 RepID=UPI0009970A14|nr:metal-dependent hydrolase [Bacillus alkalicellulosilyticus]